MEDVDYLDLFSGNPAVAGNQAQLLAQAIRQRRAAGTLGMITGDPAMAAVGKEFTGQGDKLEQNLVGAAQHRASQDIQRQHLDVESQRLAAMMGLQGARVDQGQQRIDAMNRGLALRGLRYNPNTGEFVNLNPAAGNGPPPTRPPSFLPGATSATGGGAPVPAPGPGPAAGIPPAGGKILDKRLKELGADFNPSGGRAGEFGKNQARVNAANRVLALAMDENGQPRDLAPNQMPELAQSVASLISGGGTGAQAQIEHLLPHTVRGDVQKWIQWLQGDPRGADQRAFVQQMVETAKREAAVAQQGIDQVRSQLVNKHQLVLRGNPNEARQVLNGFGWDLDANGMPVMKGAPQASAPAPAAGGASADALRKKYGL